VVSCWYPFACARAPVAVSGGSALKRRPRQAVNARSPGHGIVLRSPLHRAPTTLRRSLSGGNSPCSCIKTSPGLLGTSASEHSYLVVHEQGDALARSAQDALRISLRLRVPVALALLCSRSIDLRSSSGHAVNRCCCRCTCRAPLWPRWSRPPAEGRVVPDCRRRDITRITSVSHYCEQVRVERMRTEVPEEWIAIAVRHRRQRGAQFGGAQRGDDANGPAPTTTTRMIWSGVSADSAIRAAGTVNDNCQDLDWIIRMLTGCSAPLVCTPRLRSPCSGEAQRPALPLYMRTHQLLKWI
jgi:hypothetical protein